MWNIPGRGPSLRTVLLSLPHIPLANLRADTPVFLCSHPPLGLYPMQPSWFTWEQTPALAVGSWRPTDTTATLGSPVQGHQEAPGHLWQGETPLTGSLLTELHSHLWQLAGFSKLDKRTLWAVLTLAFHAFLRASQFTSPTTTTYSIEAGDT